MDIIQPQKDLREMHCSQRKLSRGTPGRKAPIVLMKPKKKKMSRLEGTLWTVRREAGSKIERVSQRENVPHFVAQDFILRTVGRH